MNKYVRERERAREDEVASLSFALIVTYITHT